ncbi:hypothetical protein [Cysteiniphilum litorale]|uniref:hypothetical protein n=1 Tax=Cysteiniphilum litorale TaxID=2056700 RepID=UPI003F883E52
MKTKVAIILWIMISVTPFFSFAGQGFLVTVINDTNHQITVGPAGANGFYPNDLGHDNVLAAGSSARYYTEDKAPEKDSDVLGFFVGDNKTAHYEIQPRWSIVNTITNQRSKFEACGNKWCIAICASGVCNSGITSIGLGTVRVTKNGETSPFKAYFSGGNYQVTFSASPTVCNINAGEINCNSSNIAYALVNGQLLFICQHKIQGSPACSWLSNKSSDMKSTSIY